MMLPMPSDTRDKLIASLAATQGHRRQVAELRQQLVERAGQQRDSAGRAMDVVETQLDRGSKAGAMGARYGKTLAHEHQRLSAVLAEHSDGG